MASAAYAAADKLPTGLLGRHCKTLSLYHVLAIIASQTGQLVGRFVVPFDFKLFRVDYSITTAGATHLIENVTAKVGGTAVSTPMNGSASSTTVQNGSIPILKPLTEYAAGSVVTIEIDTKSNSTVSDVALVLTVQPVVGG